MFYLFLLVAGSTLNETAKLNYHDTDIQAIPEVFTC